MIATLYFGGWHLFPFTHFHLDPIPVGMIHEVARVVLEIGNPSGLKFYFFMWFFVWVRWTIPRFRYDQLMDLGWKVMLPLSILNIVLTAVAMIISKGGFNLCSLKAETKIHLRVLPN